jgi:hypothetical protein
MVDDPGVDLIFRCGIIFPTLEPNHNRQEQNRTGAFNFTRLKGT